MVYLPPGFCGAEVDGDFVAKSPHDFAARSQNDAGEGFLRLMHSMNSSGLKM